MKKFVVKVNGVAYDVEVEENGSTGAASVPAAAPQTAAPVAKKEESKPAAPAAAPAAPAGSAGSEDIKSPMPGTIMSVSAAPGDAVKKGQVLLVLEAMKMENEIVSPRDGEVASVNVQKGASVNSGDTLVSLV